jgi:predicted metal-dependent hydrolase
MEPASVNPISKPKKGPTPKYTTIEERRAADRAKSKKYYEKNKQECIRKNLERYSKMKEKILEDHKEALEVTSIKKVN